jgi:Uma2 family endonuclease
MTFEEFLAWVEPQPRGRFELLDGVVVAMSPETGAHLRAKHRAVRALEDAITAAGLPCEALPDGATIRVDDVTAFEPDATVTCTEFIGDQATVAPNPVIVVEVLSPGTRSLDTGRKLADYFRVPSIRHYLLVMTDNRTVVHHARTADGQIATRILGTGSLALDPPGLSIEVAGLFRR